MHPDPHVVMIQRPVTCPVDLNFRYNHPRIMEYLIEKGADIEAMNARNNRPLHYAAKMGNVEVATVLISEWVLLFVCFFVLFFVFFCFFVIFTK